MYTLAITMPWFSKMYCCYGYSLKLPFTSTCSLDILHFAILNTHVQHPTHISHHGCKITCKDKDLFYFIISFYFILFSSFKKHNWLSLQVNTHTHTVSITIHNTISTHNTSWYMRKKQKNEVVWRNEVNVFKHNHTERLLI